MTAPTITAMAPEPATEDVPQPTQAAPELAWSIDDVEPVPEHRPWRVALRRAALLTLGAAAITGVIATYGLASHHRVSTPVTSTPITSTQQAAPTVVTIQAPAPTATSAPTVTIQAPAPTPTPPTTTTAPSTRPAPLSFNPTDDQRLIDLIHSQGYTVWNTEQTLRNAHLICASLRTGHSTDEIAQFLTAQTGAKSADINTLITDAMLSYPDCP